MYSAMKQAEAILKILKKKLPSEGDNDHIWYEPFLNGREKGFCIKNSENGRIVSFAENRNSDSIVVYFADEMYRDFVGNCPATEKIWNQKKYFDYQCYEEAAEFIVEKLEVLKAVSMV